MIRIERVETLEGFHSLQAAWQELLQTTANTTPFLTWEWQFSWWRHYGHNHRLWILAAYRHEQLVGIAPLMLVRQSKLGFSHRVLRPIGTPDLDQGGLLVRDNDPQVWAALLTGLMQHNAAWDVLKLDHVLFAPLDLPTLQNAFPAGRFSISGQSDAQLYIPLEGDWDTYFQGLSRNLRRDLTKRANRAGRQCDVSFEQYAGEQLTPAALCELFDINQSGRYPHLYESENDRNFHLELAERMASAAWLRLFLLRVDGVAAASCYGFLYNNRYADWRTAYRREFAGLGVGNLLLMHVLRFGFERRLAEIDFLRGAEEYKLRWGVRSRPARHWTICNRFSPAYLSFHLLPRLKRTLMGRRREEAPGV